MLAVAVCCGLRLLWTITIHAGGPCLTSLKPAIDALPNGAVSVVTEPVAHGSTLHYTCNSARYKPSTDAADSVLCNNGAVLVKGTPCGERGKRLRFAIYIRVPNICAWHICAHLQNKCMPLLKVHYQLSATDNRLVWYMQCWRLRVFPPWHLPILPMVYYYQWMWRFHMARHLTIHAMLDIQSHCAALETMWLATMGVWMWLVLPVVRSWSVLTFFPYQADGFIEWWAQLSWAYVTLYSCLLMLTYCTHGVMYLSKVLAWHNLPRGRLHGHKELLVWPPSKGS
jgi:hypothetical protein